MIELIDKDHFGKLLFEVTEQELNEIHVGLLRRPGLLSVRSAPRMTKGTRFSGDNQNYLQYKDALRAVARVKQFTLATRPVHVVFCMPVPLSVKYEDRINQPPQFTIYVNGEPVDVGQDRHQQKPDTDNLMKGFYDALASKDQIYNFMIGSKHWGKSGYIRVYDLSDRVLAELYFQK